MAEQPAEGSAPPGQWTPGQVALVAAVVILAVQVLTTLLGQAGVLPRSAAAGLNAAFTGLCGLAAGLLGARERWRERWSAAATSYRVAMWCFVLVVVHAVTYHSAAESEAKEERVRRGLDKYQQMYPPAEP